MSKWIYWNSDELLVLGLLRRYKSARRWKKNAIITHLISEVFA